MRDSKAPFRRTARGSKRVSTLGTVKEYIRRINAGDARGLGRLSSPYLKFIDATGARFRLTEDGWRAYFSDFPDYRIRVQQILSAGNTVAVFGFGSGSFKGRGSARGSAHWQFPAAWRAVVRAGKLVEWQVYCDVEPMLQSAGRGRF